MTDQELEAIAAREQRSTLGPWSVKRVQNLYPSEAGDGRTYPAVRGFRCPKAIYERAWEQVEHDAQFMAGARSDVPLLINEVRRLRRRLREIHTAVSENVQFKPGVSPRDLLALVEEILREEDAHAKGGPVPPAREAEYLR
jgi:hypothetical protein